jgi:hypothetical protein
MLKVHFSDLDVLKYLCVYPLKLSAIKPFSATLFLNFIPECLIRSIGNF